MKANSNKLGKEESAMAAPWASPLAPSIDYPVDVPTIL